MVIFDIISVILLSLLLFWSVYNGSIIYIGIKSKRRQVTNIIESEDFPKFSIIVPTKDEEIVVGRCLNGLLALDYPKDKMQVIIVDGNSKDSTRSICSEFLANIHKPSALLMKKNPAENPLLSTLPYLW